MDTKIKLSVIVITYNQEKYIEHTLESIASQKTDFDFEVLVGDDRSSDNTASIVKKFSEKYPDKFIPIIRETNYGMVENFLDLISRAKGEYYAFLEGDDYWIRDDKLQKQVDFLDSHPEYAACFGKMIIVDQDDKRNEGLEKYSAYWQESGDYSIKILADLYKLPGQTGTSVYRSQMYDKAFENAMSKGFDRKRFRDIYMVIMTLSQGKIYTMEDVLSAYRYIVDPSSGSWSSKNDSYSFNNLMTYLEDLKYMEDFAKDIGLILDYDERRKYEWDKLQNNGEDFSKEKKGIIKKTLIGDSNNKLAFTLHRIKLAIKKT